MNNLLQRLMLGGSSAAMLAAVAIGSGPALAQETAPAEEVTVTGTSIRGVAPVGSNVITVDQEAIRVSGAVNAEQLLNTVPAISTAGGAPQGVNVNSGFQPQIHQLAGSVSNSTLAVVNGMRFVGQGGNGLSDPNIIPTSALQRVEVLADGASSIYGSDAVSGVVNFIIRKDYEGLELNAQVGFADDYSTGTGTLLWGTKWQSGSVMVAASYTAQSALLGGSRPLLAMGDYTPIGGNNFIEVFGCPTASMIVPGNTGVWLSPASTTTVANTQANKNCNLQPYGDALPQSTRRNALMQVSQDFGSRLSASFMMLYNELDIAYRDRPGTITANTTVYGPGSNKTYILGGSNPPVTISQVNPFFQAPAGAPTATQENVSWVDLMGNGTNGHDYGRDTENEEAYYAQAGATYRLTDDWEVKLTDAFGVNRDDTGSLNTFCASCATLALNGTAQTSGSTTASDVSGQNVISLNTSLTTANALDVWDPAGASNKTSTLIQKQLYSNNSRADTQNTFNQLRLEVDGPLFDLPAGAVKVAAGGEYVNYHQLAYSNGTLGIGVQSNGATISQFYSRRSVLSGFVEVNAPLVSSDMHVPLMQALTLDISARYDKYSDVGPTFNPKYGLDWKVTDDIKFRANYSTSFVAAPVGVAGDPTEGGEYGGGASLAPSFNVPIAAFPTVTSLPGCGTVQVTTQGYCTLGSGTLSPGLSRQYGSALGGAKPQTGNGVNLGFDFTPTFLPGLSVTLTYFDQKYKGGVTAPNITQITTISAFNHLLTLCPTGCTQQQIDDFTRVPEGGTVSGSLPPVIYSLQNHDENNVLNLAIQGIDLDARYDIPTDYGDFHVGDALTQFFVFDQSVVGGASFSELGTSGINSTFPSVAYHTRANFGWTNNVIAADLFVNWTAPYRNATNTAVHPITTDANGNFSGGGDHVSANVTLDAHVSYNFPDGMLQGDQVYLDVQNLADTTPPFYNGTSKPSEVHSQAGENIFISNPIGRIISLGMRATF